MKMFRCCDERMRFIAHAFYVAAWGMHCVADNRNQLYLYNESETLTFEQFIPSTASSLSNLQFT